MQNVGFRRTGSCRLLLSSDGSTLCPETLAHTITSWYFCFSVYSTIEIKILMPHAYGVSGLFSFFTLVKKMRYEN